MINLVSLLLLALTAWTVSTLMSKSKHEDEIKKELGNIFESVRYFSASVIMLFRLLMKDSMSSAKETDFSIVKNNVVQLLKVERDTKDEVEKAA